MFQRITKEDQEILKKKFPKFGKEAACMCNNPSYGVTLSPAAKRWLKDAKNGRKSKETTLYKLEEYLQDTGLSVEEFIEGARRDIR